MPNYDDFDIQFEPPTVDELLANEPKTADRPPLPPRELNLDANAGKSLLPKLNVGTWQPDQSSIDSMVSGETEMPGLQGIFRGS